MLNHPKFQASKGVAVFLSLPDEIDTKDIIENVFAAGKKCYIPRCDSHFFPSYMFTIVMILVYRYQEDGHHMTMIRVTSLEDVNNLPKTKWNIPQPPETEEREDCLKTGGIDLILTPGLGFTKCGCRIGRGKGYYDKFFQSYKSSFPFPYLIGLALKESIIHSIPMTESDVKLDEILFST